jgi:hypothetical protein
VTRQAGTSSRNTAVAGGVGVLVVTGLAGFSQFAGPRSTTATLVTGIALLAILLIGAWFLARFVAKHGDEIGEARFDTRNKDRQDG